MHSRLSLILVENRTEILQQEGGRSRLWISKLRFMKGLLIIAAKKRKGKMVLLTCSAMAQTKYLSHRLAKAGK